MHCRAQNKTAPAMLFTTNVGSFCVESARQYFFGYLYAGTKSAAKPTFALVTYQSSISVKHF